MLTSSIAGLGAAGLGWNWYRQHQRSIRIALIGCGMRGGQLAGLIHHSGWHDIKGEIVAVCDANRLRAEQVRQRYAPSADVTQNFQQVLNRNDVDAVFIATPDHWHSRCALAALQAGKHVYCEKPMTLTIAEGQQLVAAATASDRTFLVGTQQRSHRQFQQAVELIRCGRLGQINRIEISVPVNRSGGPFSAQPVPDELDWENWLGPAPYAEYCPERYRGFRFWYEYSGGSMTDWGAHNVDIAQWALNVDQSGPIAVSADAAIPSVENGYNTPPQFEVEMKYASGTTIVVRPSAAESGILFEGDEGRIYVNRKRLTGKPVEELGRRPLPVTAERFGHRRTTIYNSYNMAHVLHFFDCITRGEKPISDVISQHRSASACHLANIAMRLGRSVRWNPETEQFDDDHEATAMLTRPSRIV